jgi:hypothetical protein
MEKYANSIETLKDAEHKVKSNYHFADDLSRACYNVFCFMISFT